MLAVLSDRIFGDPVSHPLLGPHIKRKAEMCIYVADRTYRVAVEIDVVNINPFCPEEVHYGREQIPQMRAWAQVIKVEQALETMGTRRPDFATVKSFSEYYFVMEQSQYITLAPDGRGRKLAALFTAEDALENFLERNASREGLKAVPINGEKLFNAIRLMPLEGLVFNCSGPAKPRAFPMAFCDEVLNKG